MTIKAPVGLQELVSERSALTASEIASFERHGFLVRASGLPAEVVAKSIAAAERLVEFGLTLPVGTTKHRGSEFVIKEGTSRPAVARVVWAGAMEPDILALSRTPNVLRPVRDALHSVLPPPYEADQLINALHVKLPGDRVHFPWHQDLRHRKAFDPDWIDVNGRGSFVQTLVALDPMKSDNGPIVMIAGSHRFGHLPIDYKRTSPTLDDAALPPEVRNLERVTLALAPGDLVLFHPLVVHGSNPNEGGERRLAVVSGFAYPGANHGKYPGEGSGERIVLP